VCRAEFGALLRPANVGMERVVPCDVVIGSAYEERELMEGRRDAAGYREDHTRRPWVDAGMATNCGEDRNSG
jgi:hypothetical protein